MTIRQSLQNRMAEGQGTTMQFDDSEHGMAQARRTRDMFAAVRAATNAIGDTAATSPGAYEGVALAILSALVDMHRTESNAVVLALVTAIGNYALVSGTDGRNHYAMRLADVVREALTGDFFPRGE